MPESPPPIPRSGRNYTYTETAAVLRLKTTQSVRRLVRAGQLRVTDVSSTGSGTRPRVTGASLVAFLERREMRDAV